MGRGPSQVAATTRWVTYLVAGAAVVCLVTALFAVSPIGDWAAPATPMPAVAPVAPHRNPFAGLGSWVDMYAWSVTFAGPKPRFGLADVDTMAADGVQTLFIQGASQTGPAAVLEPQRLSALIERAHQRSMAVVVWYLPSLVNPADDLTRLIAIGHLAVEGVGVDIESIDVGDIGQRNAALIHVSQELRRNLPATPIGAIVMPPTLLEVINPHFWPAFPWRAIAGSYDAWLPMTYWTLRSSESGLRDGFTYADDSIHRLRADLGTPVAAIHPIGGNGIDGIHNNDVERFVTAIHANGAIGGSVYEWVGTDAVLWPKLRSLRS